MFKNIHSIDISLMEEVTYFAIQKLTVVEKCKVARTLVMVKYYTQLWDRKENSWAF